MKRDKFVIRPGKICSLDRNNTVLKQDTSGIAHVEVLRKVSGGLFRKAVWEVRDADSPNTGTFKCLEEHLTPEGMSIIRFPANIPEFNYNDIRAIEDVFNSSRIDISTNTYKRLKALKEKIEFCLHLKEV